MTNEITRRGMGALAMGTAALLAGKVAGPAAALAQGTKQLRIGLREDPDIMDPTLARSFVGRIVFCSLCDKLFDVNEKLEIVPQLATGYKYEDPKTLLITLREGVKFHDGETMDAEAVRYSLMRHLTMSGSFRKGEIGIMDTVEVVDPKTVRIRLKAPSAPFISQLTDRAGMIISPKAAEAAGKDFGAKPVGTGPFRFVERVAQDRIVVERFPDYWDKGRIFLDRITYQVIVDSTVRLANLRAGTLDLIENVSPTDVKDLKDDRRIKLEIGDGLGYNGITVNQNNGEQSKTPIGQDARVREAFDLAIDREALIQVVYEGMFTPATQAVAPASPYHDSSRKVVKRDVARAKALLAEAKVPTPYKVEIMVANSPEIRQSAEVIQSMVAEAGFDLQIKAVEFASGLQAAVRGEFQLYMSAWSGRPDPDGNTWAFMHSKGPQNDGRYNSPETDRILDAQREETDPEKRKELFRQLWAQALDKDHFRSYLWYLKNIVAHSPKLQGFRPMPDGMIRVQDLKVG
ncbi:ABC transporter substrate-binding protein [Roseomonas elaeocarpi]|uniref:ABC transporter substrate-binding protein n=1 Tax=Roseomonas elaeocarpi TaxID=907779 RepID=A0ABV6JXP1_9PROT